jgi:hypothetical protein
MSPSWLENMRKIVRLPGETQQQIATKQLTASIRYMLADMAPEERQPVRPIHRCNRTFHGGHGRRGGQYVCHQRPGKRYSSDCHHSWQNYMVRRGALHSGIWLPVLVRRLGSVQVILDSGTATVNSTAIISSTVTGNAHDSAGSRNAVPITSSVATFTTGCASACSGTLVTIEITPADTGTQIPGSQISSAVPTATALATLATLRSAGNYPLGILANGNSAGCTPAGGGGSVANPYTNINAVLVYSANLIPCLKGPISFAQWPGIGSQQGQGTRLFTAAAGGIGLAADGSALDVFGQLTVTSGAGLLSALTAGSLAITVCGMVP